MSLHADKSAAWLALTLVPGIGLQSFWHLLDAFGDPLSALVASPQELKSKTNLSENQRQALGSHWLDQGRLELEALARLGAVAVSADSPLYPDLLHHLPDPPPVLFALGNLEILTLPLVAVVGSRAATSYGRRVAFDLGKGLWQQGVGVVSGLAAGIDSQAHSGALAAEGLTVAVLGCGLDMVYPRQNQELQEKIGTQGLLLSEYPLGTRPDGFRFPARNRIIAGLSLGTVVVEAERRSGSLITAQIALDLGREVFAVPGQVDSKKSEGSHWLLRQGAKLVAGAADIAAEILAGNLIGSDTGKSNEAVGNLSGLEPEAAKLLLQLDNYPVNRQQLLENSGCQAARLSELLLLLELDGLIEMLPGDRVCRKSKTGC